SAPAASSVSAISCCGISPIRNSISQKPCGRSFRPRTCKPPWLISACARAVSAKLQRRSRRRLMLRARVITGCILGALLLLGLFLLPAFWAVLAFGLVFIIGAWEGAGFGALRKPFPA